MTHEKMELSIGVDLSPQIIQLEIDDGNEYQMEVGSRDGSQYQCQIPMTVDISQKPIPLEIGGCDAYQMEVESPIMPQYSGADEYDGGYTVVPAFEAQRLETKNKLLKSDVEVEAISVSRVSNLSGGTTVYIGGLFNA